MAVTLAVLFSVAASVMQAEYLGDWQSARLRPAGDVIGMAYGDGRFVVTTSLTLAQSADGVWWQDAARLPSGDVVHGYGPVVWTGSMFLTWEGPAPGTTTLTSRDGTAWSEAGVFCGYPVAAAAASDSGHVVAMDSSGNVGASDDGQEWKCSVLPGWYPSRAAIAWGNGRFVAVGNGIYSSSDGEAWTLRVPAGNVYSRSTVVWTGERFVVARYADGTTSIAISHDGETWTVTSGMFSAEEVALVGTAGGQVVAYGPTRAYVSPDGLSWTPDAPLPLDGCALTNVVKVQGRFWTARCGAVLSSTDLLRWEGDTGTPNLAAVAYGNRRYVAVGSRERRDGKTGFVMTRTPAGEWSVVTPDLPAPLLDVVFTGSTFVAVGEGGAAYLSSNGLEWEIVPSPLLSGWKARGLVWNGSRLLALGGGSGLLSSPDGRSWSSLPGPAFGVGDIAWAGTHYVAVGTMSNPSNFWAELAVEARSEDGSTWSEPEVVAAGIEKGIVAFGYVAAIGTEVVSGGYYTDEDLYHRTIGGVPIGAPYGWVKFLSTAGPFFVACSDLGILARLQGTWDWHEIPGAPRYLNAVAGAGREAVAVGSYGTVATAAMETGLSIGSASTGTWVVPTAAHVGGLVGTAWRTDVALFNPGAEEAVVGTYLLARGRDNLDPLPHVVTLQPGKQVLLEDVVKTALGEASAAGTLVLVAKNELLISSRTFTSMPGGTFGQHVPALRLDQGLEGGDEARLIGLARNARFRTNLGFANVSGEPARVDVELHDDSGLLLASRAFDLKGWESLQVTDVFGYLHAPNVEDGYAVVRPRSAGRVFAYASVIDNRTGDPTCVLPSLAVTDEPLLLPSAAHVDGLNRSVWRTDLEVCNTGPTQATFTIELLPGGRDNTVAVGGTFTLVPGGCRRYPDLVGELFATSGSGALRVTPRAGVVAASARTYCLTTEGTFGQSIPGTPASAGVVSEGGWRLVQLSQSAMAGEGFRTNVGFLNLEPVPLRVEAKAWFADGQASGLKILDLPPFGFLQDNHFLVEVGASAPLASVTVRPLTPGARVLAYASVVDNRSGDAIYIPGQ